MNDVKQAVTTAQRFLSEIIDTAQSVRLEEVEPAEEEAGWSITLSFLGPVDNPLEQLQRRRTYKRFLVVDDQVQSMKIRELEGA